MCEGTESLEAENSRLRSENKRLQALVKEWGLESGPPIHIKTAPLDHPKEVAPEDILTLTVYQDDGAGRRTVDSLTAQINKQFRATHFSIYSFDDALGYNHAVCGVFGEKK